jgi:hypothetical protein
MKRMVSILFVLICFAGAFAEDTIQGMYSYTYGDSESLVEARATCKNLALRDALESYYLFVESVTDVENFQLKEDLVKSITAGSLRDATIVDQSEEGRTITMTVTARVDPQEVQAQIDKAVQNTQPSASQPAQAPTQTTAAEDASFFQDMERYHSKVTAAESDLDTQDSHKLILLFQQAGKYLEMHKPNPNSPFQKAIYACVQSRNDLLREYARLKYFQNERKRLEALNQRKVVATQSARLQKAVSALKSMQYLTDAQESIQQNWVARCERTLSWGERLKARR